MGKQDPKKELLRRLSESEKKESRMIYISGDVWKQLTDWCDKQNPKQKPSRVIEELIRMFFDENEKK